MTREELIQKNKDLFWYIRKDALKEMSDDVLVEFIMNYGDMEALRDLINVLGIEKLRIVYNNVQGRRVGNYKIEFLRFLKRIIDYYVPANTI